MKRLALSLLASAALVGASFAQTINVTPRGGGGGGGGSGVNSITKACPAGDPQTGDVTLSNALTVTAESGNFSPSATTDCGGAFVVTLSAPHTMTLPAPASGFYLSAVTNVAASTSPLAMTPTSGLIDGVSSENLPAGRTVAIYTDGTNYYTDFYVVGSPTGPGYKATNWYIAGGFVASGTSTAPTAATVYCYPGWIHNVVAPPTGGGSMTIDALTMRITTIGTSNATLAIYADDTTASPHRPGALVASTNTFVDTSLTVTSQALVSNASLSQGEYWFCGMVNDTTVRYQARSGSATSDLSMVSQIGSATIANSVGGSNNTAGVSTTSGITFGTWPSTFVGAGATWTEVGTVIPLVGFHIASIP